MMTPTDIDTLTRFATFVYAQFILRQQARPTSQREAEELASLASMLIKGGEEKFDPLNNDRQAYRMVNVVGLTLCQPGCVVDDKKNIVWAESLSFHLWNNEKASRYAMVKAVASLNIGDPNFSDDDLLMLKQLLYERKPKHNLTGI